MNGHRSRYCLTKTGSQKFGDLAEELAIKHLQKKGYKILATNYRYGHKEIDIICEKGDQVVFVEVKAARAKSFGPPEGWVDGKKRKNLIIAAQAYIQENELSDKSFRFDVITCTKTRDGFDINHLESAFFAE